MQFRIPRREVDDSREETRKRRVVDPLPGFFNSMSVKRATIMVGVSADDNVVTIMSKKSTPYTDSDRKDYRGPLKILRSLSTVREYTGEYISANQLSHYASICSADPDTGRPCMWGCEHCSWKHLQDKTTLVTQLDRLPNRPIAGIHDECKCQHFRHAMHMTIYNRNARNRQALLKGISNQIKFPDATRHRGVTFNDPSSASNMFKHMEVEGGEVISRLHAPANEMSWCPCVNYAREVKDIIYRFYTKKLQGIEALGGLLMAYLYTFTKLPIDIGFDRARQDVDQQYLDDDEEDVAYFIDVRWAENE